MWIPSFCSSNYSVCLSVSSTCVHRCVHVCVYLLPAVGVDSSRCTCFPFPLTGTALLWYYSPGLIATLKCICLCINLLVAPTCLSSHWPAWKTYLPDPLSRTLSRTPWDLGTESSPRRESWRTYLNLSSCTLSLWFGTLRRSWWTFIILVNSWTCSLNSLDALAAVSCYWISLGKTG